MRLGFEIEVENTTPILPPDTGFYDEATYTGIPGVRITRDGSLRNGYEYVTDVLPDTDYAVSLYKYLHNRIQGNYSERCGFHFHLDFSNKNTAEIVQFISNYIKLERTLFRIYPEWFRSNNNFCNLLVDSPDEIALIRSTLHNDRLDPLSEFSKYTALNLKPLIYQSSMEFRATFAGLPSDDMTVIFTIFKDIYNNNISAYLENVTEQDLAEAQAIIDLIYTPIEETTDSLEFMDHHFSVEQPILPTKTLIEQFLSEL